jgi:hypothetical protein
MPIFLFQQRTWKVESYKLYHDLKKTQSSTTNLRYLL